MMIVVMKVAGSMKTINNHINELMEPVNQGVRHHPERVK